MVDGDNWKKQKWVCWVGPGHLGVGEQVAENLSPEGGETKLGVHVSPCHGISLTKHKYADKIISRQWLKSIKSQGEGAFEREQGLVQLHRSLNPCSQPINL